eukprot:13440634-Alexandrium_andersonii.AAC.1
MKLPALGTDRARGARGSQAGKTHRASCLRLRTVQLASASATVHASVACMVPITDHGRTRASVLRFGCVGPSRAVVCAGRGACLCCVGRWGPVRVRRCSGRASVR